VLVVDVPDETFEDYEHVSDGGTYREAMITAAQLPSCRPRLVRRRATRTLSSATGLQTRVRDIKRSEIVFDDEVLLRLEL